MIATRTDGTLRLQVTDDRVFAGMALAEAVQAELRAEDRQVVLDLSRVQVMHSPLLAAVVSVHVRLGREGRALVLSGLSAQNRAILRTTRLDAIIRCE